MGTLIVPGQTLIAGTANGQLGQSYGTGDGNPTTVTATTFQDLSSVYTIPANEASTGSIYEMTCGGSGTQGGTAQLLKFAMSMNGTAFAGGTSGQVPAATVAASTAFAWAARLTLVCTDGVSAWQCLMEGSVQSGGSASGEANFVIAASRTAAVNAAITVAAMFSWGGTGATITNNVTTWKKTA